LVGDNVSSDSKAVLTRATKVQEALESNKPEVKIERNESYAQYGGADKGAYEEAEKKIGFSALMDDEAVSDEKVELKVQEYVKAYNQKRKDIKGEIDKAISEEEAKQAQKAANLVEQVKEEIAAFDAEDEKNASEGIEHWKERIALFTSKALFEGIEAAQNQELQQKKDGAIADAKDYKTPELSDEAGVDEYNKYKNTFQDLRLKLVQLSADKEKYEKEAIDCQNKYRDTYKETMGQLHNLSEDLEVKFLKVGASDLLKHKALLENALDTIKGKEYVTVQKNFVTGLKTALDALKGGLTNALNQYRQDIAEAFNKALNDAISEETGTLESIKTYNEEQLAGASAEFISQFGTFKTKRDHLTNLWVQDLLEVDKTISDLKTKFDKALEVRKEELKAPVEEKAAPMSAEKETEKTEAPTPAVSAAPAETEASASPSQPKKPKKKHGGNK